MQMESPLRRIPTFETLEQRANPAPFVGASPIPFPGVEVNALATQSIAGEVWLYGELGGAPVRIEVPEFADGSPGEPIELVHLTTPSGYSTGTKLQGAGEIMVSTVFNDETGSAHVALWTSATEVTMPLGVLEESFSIDLVHLPVPIVLAQVGARAVLLINQQTVQLPAGFRGRSLLEPAAGDGSLLIAGSLNGQGAIVSYDLLSGAQSTLLIPNNQPGSLDHAFELTRMPDGSESPIALIQRQSAEGPARLTLINALTGAVITEYGACIPDTAQTSYGVTTFQRSDGFILHITGGHEAKLLGTAPGVPIPVEALLQSLGLDLSALNPPAQISDIVDIDARRLGYIKVALQLSVGGVPVPIELHAGDPTPFTNPDPRTGGHLDVDRNGRISAFDALVIINLLNARGPTALDRSAAVPGIGTNPYLDPNGNGIVTAFDAIAVINHLNLFGVTPLPPLGPEEGGGEYVGNAPVDLEIERMIALLSLDRERARNQS